MSADSAAERETAGRGEAEPADARPGEAQPGIAQPGIAQPGKAQPGIAQPGKALRAAGQIAAQHKIATAVGGVFAAAILAVSLVGSGGGGAHPAAEPVAPGFTVAALSASGPGAGGAGGAAHITLSQYQGKPLIVNFWASWCAPCQGETPLLARWYARQHGHVVLVGLDVNDTAANALKFARAKDVTYPIGADPNATVAGTYGVVALPQTFFLNAQHRIVDHVFGAVTQASLAAGVRLMDASGS